MWTSQMFPASMSKVRQSLNSRGDTSQSTRWLRQRAPRKSLSMIKSTTIASLWKRTQYQYQLRSSSQSSLIPPARSNSIRYCKLLVENPQSLLLAAKVWCSMKQVWPTSRILEPSRTWRWQRVCSRISRYRWPPEPTSSCSLEAPAR